ncbi:hypothetical protein BB560_001702 [Smittium megazygosporum]|uniref:TBP-associated factor 12 n=1 Tax=Smittium megazygosporum TaxID=133381 RepID=A0A2T9ZGT1_9FUNG|nr:hypothetical protein BB560_001702 [Smittium megazygosporum]
MEHSLLGNSLQSSAQNDGNSSDQSENFESNMSPNIRTQSPNIDSDSAESMSSEFFHPAKKMRKYEPPETLAVLPKTKFSQAQTLLVKLKIIMEKADSFFREYNLDEIISKITPFTDSPVVYLTGGEEEASWLLVYCLTTAVSSIQDRLTILSSEFLKNKEDEKLFAPALDFSDKLKYSLFQISNFAASNSIQIQSDRQFKPESHLYDLPDAGLDNNAMPNSLSKNSQRASDYGSKYGYGNDPSNSYTTVNLSAPITQVVAAKLKRKENIFFNQDKKLVSKKQIQELVAEISPNERIEPDVENLLCDIADEFVESVVDFACKLAKHRKSNTLEAKDIQLHLEKNWNIRVPGFSAEEIRSVRKSNFPSSYQQRLNAINSAKSLKRFD